MNLKSVYDCHSFSSSNLWMWFGLKWELQQQHLCLERVQHLFGFTGSTVWPFEETRWNTQPSLHSVSAKLPGPQVRHPDQRVLANMARRWETRRPSSLTFCQHGPGSVPARSHQSLRQSPWVGTFVLFLAFTLTCSLLLCFVFNLFKILHLHKKSFQFAFIEQEYHVTTLSYVILVQM